MVVSCLDAADGGPPAAVLGLAIGLRGLDQDVTIVTHRHSGREVHDAVTSAEAAGVRIRWVDREHATRFQYSPALMRAAREESRQADSITCHGFYQWTCVVGYVIASQAHQSLLLQPHGVFEPYQELESGRIKGIFRRLIGYRILRRVDAIVAASESEVAGFAETLGSHSPPVLLAGLGVDVEPGAHPHSFDRRAVMFLSRVAPKKRLDKLLDAGRILAERGRPISITVCGDGDREFVAGLKASAPPSVEVSWRGHVVDPERAVIEAEHALMCLPSDNENFGQVVTEAMARGLPVVTTRSTGSSKHLERAGAGWVLDAPTADELAECLDAALGDADELARMSKRGVQYASSELTWAAVAGRWIDQVERLKGAQRS